MSFDKMKAMRNAERYLSQGKIRSAINEYRDVVKHDAKDMGTLNLLGDLYVKNSQKNEAINCYSVVAEHYSNQGFAQKAIAIYNKIRKLDPDSVEISSKLAELYKVKGSVTEAKSHYITLAEHYQSKGRQIEALAIWKQIALLDPNNTEVYSTIAKTYAEEGAIEEAADAWAEAGLRFSKLGRSAEADEAFGRALELMPADPKALSGVVNAKLEAGKADEAIRQLTEILASDPHNRDVLSLQLDCYLRAGDLAAAEKAVVRLVELEPANYPRFLELARIYIANSDPGSATRILTMSSEHMLMGGQAEVLDEMVSSVLAGDADCLDALRLRVRYCTWQRDEAAFRESLERLAEVANKQGSIEDERHALSQLVMIVPQETRFADRLTEINTEYGYEQQDLEESLFDRRFFKNSDHEAPEAEPSAEYAFESTATTVDETVEFAIIDAEAEPALPSFSEAVEIERAGVSVVEAGLDADFGEESATEFDDPAIHLRKEAESIRFYIDSGYCELAEKAINELRGEFGDNAEIKALGDYLVQQAAIAEPAADFDASSQNTSEFTTTGSFDLSDFRSELGLEEAAVSDDSDYDTHYHTAIAYQEMGLLEDAIKEFQEAISLVDPGDASRRFFQCANLLGHCFMQKGMPNLALTWYQRTLETPGLDDEEKQALWYELAAAYEAEGDMENAGRYYEQVYAENINFRDVSERVKNMTVSH